MPGRQLEEDEEWKGGEGQSVVWISLYNYLVTRNNGVEPGNMPKTFNEPPPHVGVSWLHTGTHTHTQTRHLHTCVNSAGSCARCCKSRKSLAAQKKRKENQKRKQKAARRIMR